MCDTFFSPCTHLCVISVSQGCGWNRRGAGSRQRPNSLKAVKSLLIMDALSLENCFNYYRSWMFFRYVWLENRLVTIMESNNLS